MAAAELTHLDERGAARMVDVGEKQITARRAVAVGQVRCSAALRERLERDDLAKGSALQVARVAGIQAAKRTADLIPLCHALPLDSVTVDLTLTTTGVAIRAEVCTHWRTGVEMEAFTAVAVAALTVVDMGKAVDPAMVIEGLRLLQKSGGRHGDYQAPEVLP